MNFDIEMIAIKACLIASLYPFVLYVCDTLIINKKWRYFFLVLFIMVAFYLKSRLLFVGIIVTFFIHYKQKIKPKLLILLSILVIVVLFFLNSDSIIGRFFIWKTTISNIHSVPLKGFGIDSFKSNYANWQSNYFEINKLWSNYHFVADSPSFAYNEVLNFYVEIGIFSFIIFRIVTFINVLFFKIIKTTFYRHVTMSTIVILFFAQFSFPLHNILILTIFTCNHIMLISIVFKPLKLFCISLCIFLIIIAVFLFFQNIKAKDDWHYAQSIPTQYKIDKVAQYENCYMSLRKNQYFLTDFCQYLISEGMTNRALDLVLSNGDYFNQYEKYILLGDIYLKKDEFALAKFNYRKANHIIPSRLMPLGNLMTVSLLEKDTLLAKQYSNRIILQPSKVESKLGDRIKKDAFKILSLK